MSSMQTRRGDYSTPTNTTPGHSGSDMAEKAKDTASSTYETVKDKASEAFDAAKTTAAGALETAQSAGAQGLETARSLAGSAGEAFSSTLEEQKTAGADAVAKAAQSAREAAEGLEKDAPQIAGIIKSAAMSVENFSNDIKDKTVTEMMDSVTEFAKQRPMAFLACGVAAGFIVSRMLASSNRA